MQTNTDREYIILSDSIKEIVKEAGQIMLDAHLSRSEIISKSGHQNYVTEYDRKVQSFLEEKLQKLCPGALFYAEEDEEHNEDILSAGDVFVIDPIDGTSNFMKGYFPSCISVGMLRDGKPYLGVVYIPLSGEMFSAVAGRGAQKNGEPIFSSQDPLEESLACFGTAPYYSQKLRDQAYKVARFYQERCIDVRRSGSAAYDLCMVACGAAGVYAEPLIQLWDYCAAALIASEAGAKVTDFYGNAPDFRRATSVAAAGAVIAKGSYLPEFL